jgi:hypothetical protein
MPSIHIFIGIVYSFIRCMNMLYYSKLSSNSSDNDTSRRYRFSSREDHKTCSGGMTDRV